jgi:tetratricopeptide (TPR) repeat protein
MQDQTPTVQKLRYACMGAALIGHLIEQQVSFSATATSTVVWLIAALLISDGLPAVSRPSPVKQVTLRIVHIAIYIMAAALLIAAVIQPIRADIKYDASQDWSKSEAARFAAAQRATRYFPLQSEYWQGLAVASAHAGDLITAHNAIDKALSLEPENPHIHALWGDLLTGVLYHITGTLNQAINAYYKAVQLAPTVADYQTSLGIVYARQGNLRLSRLALEKAVTLDPTEPIAFTSLASTYEAMGETELAQRAREQADDFLEKR